jgi:asparagine synthetase B (glutamine-hydrolysing)
MVQASPAMDGHVEVAVAAGGAAVRLFCFAQNAPDLGYWQEHAALLDGYVLDPAALVKRLRKQEIAAERDWGDARLLAALWSLEGATALADVDGDFNLCLMHVDTGAVSLLSSRHGSRHLYYMVTAEFLAFSPYLAGLSTLVAPVVNRLSLQDMFNFGYIGGDRTMLQDVRLLAGATELVAAHGHCRQHRYWQPRYANDVEQAASFDDLVDEAGAGLQSAVDLYLQRFSRVAIPISGGLDSRTILAFAGQRQEGLPAYHCNWYSGEAEIARQLVVAAGARWHERDPLKFDFADILEEGGRRTEGNTHCHQFWFQPVARELRERGETDILLDGYLMDVFFGDTFLVLPEQRLYGDVERRNIINGLWRRCRPTFVRRAFLPAFYDEYEQANRDSLDEQMACVEEENLSNYIHSFSFANRSNRYSVALPNAQRQYVEYGYPGLHGPLVDLYLRIPPAYKVGAAFSRAMLQRFAPEAARVPWAKTGRPLHHDKTWHDRLVERLSLRQAGSLALLRATGGRWDVSHRADLNRHFRRHEAFRRAHLAVADDDRTFSRGIIDRAGLRRLTDMIDRGWPVFFLLQSLVTVELFHRRIID